MGGNTPDPVPRTAVWRDRFGKPFDAARCGAWYDLSRGRPFPRMIMHGSGTAPSEYLTIRQASDLLQISRESLYKYARAGKVPAVKVGRHWRFHRAEIEKRLRLGVEQDSSSDWPAAAPARSLHVLLVEDDPSVSRLLSTWIERHGHRVASAARGGEALRLTNTGRFDLILLDLHLPDMTGAEFLARIPEPGRPPTVLITGIPESPILNAALEHPILFALTKPFREEQLAGVLRMVRQERIAEANDPGTGRPGP